MVDFQGIAKEAAPPLRKHWFLSFYL